MLRNQVRRFHNLLQKLASVMEIIFATHGDHKDYFTKWSSTLSPSEQLLLGQVSFIILRAMFPGGYFGEENFERLSQELANLYEKTEASFAECAKALTLAPADVSPALRQSYSELKACWLNRNTLVRGVEITAEVSEACWQADQRLMTGARGFVFYLAKVCPQSTLLRYAQELLGLLGSLKDLQAEVNELILASVRQQAFNQACSGWYLNGQVKSLQAFFENERELESILLEWLPKLQPIEEQWLNNLSQQKSVDVRADLLWKQHEIWVQYLIDHPEYYDTTQINRFGFFAQENDAPNAAAKLWEKGCRIDALRLLLPGAFHGKLPCIEQLIHCVAPSHPHIALKMLYAKSVRVVDDAAFLLVLNEIKRMHNKMLESVPVKLDPELQSLYAKMEQQFSLDNAELAFSNEPANVQSRLLLRLAQVQLELFKETSRRFEELNQAQKLLMKKSAEMSASIFQVSQSESDRLLQKVQAVLKENVYLNSACALLRRSYDQNPQLKTQIKSICDDFLLMNLPMPSRGDWLSVLEHCGFELPSTKPQFP